MDKPNLNINVEKIMEEIRERAAEEQEKAQNAMFNREIDVAGIMRNIRHDVLDSGEPDVLASGDADRISTQLRGIYNEIERINCYAVNTRAEAALKMEPGCTIPVAQSRPRLIQKLFTLIKRLVRKATRFLVLDQKEYNEKMNDCMKAMCESQEQVLKLTKMIMDQSAYQAAFQTQAQMELQSTSGKILALYGQLNSQRDFQIQTESVFRNTAKKLAELYKQLEEMENGLRLEIAAVSRDMAEVQTALEEDNHEELHQKIEALCHRSDEMQIFMEEHTARQEEMYRELRRKLELLDRQSDAFSASVAKTILSYKKENGIPVERYAPQTADSAPKKESGDSYTALNYFKFQNNFRGTRSQIIERQTIYLPYFKDSTEPVLDIGCGRGELLHILREEDIPAFGIDLYPEYVIEGELSGLDVRQGDGIAFLKETDMRFGGIFSAHVVEHISFANLQTRCFTAYEKLVPGGYLILETPNPTCLSIFSNAFYVDPTHIKPVHPLLLAYILREAGFSEVQTVYTEATRAGEPLPLIDSDAIRNLDEVNHAIERVSSLLYGSQDYAVIAKK